MATITTSVSSSRVSSRSTWGLNLPSRSKTRVQRATLSPETLPSVAVTARGAQPFRTSTPSWRLSSISQA